MSKQHHLREDKTCQNCGYHVDERFCSRCGQENTESRQSFRHLIAHFFEDITHYEGRFWPTMRNLFLKPGWLTVQYLEGKRSRFVVPVRLYIFISFITFLLPHLLPINTDSHAEYTGESYRKTDTTVHNNFLFTNEDDSMKIIMPNRYSSIQQLDSAAAAMPEGEKMSVWQYMTYKRSIELRHYSSRQLWLKFTETLSSNFPKTLFLFMPLFALIIWLFHGKKRWYYFDHALFTLHYFSFYLLLFDLVYLLKFAIHFMVSEQTYLGINALSYIFLFLSGMIYFFAAHRKMYGENILVSSVKALSVYIINLTLFFVLLILLSIFTLLVMH